MMCRTLLAAAALSLTAASAYGADAVRAGVERQDGYVRVNFVWPESVADETITADTQVENQVLIVKFSRQVDIDVTAIKRGLSAEAALARLDPDQRTLRIALNVPARAHVSRSYNVLAVDLLPPEADDPADVVSPRAKAEAEARRRAVAEAEAAAETAPPPPPALPVTRASSPAFDRIVFEWPERVDYMLGESDGRWELRFDRDATPALGSLRSDPPARLESIDAVHDDGELVIQIVPAPGMAPRVSRERDWVILDIAAGGGDSELIAQLKAMADNMNGDGDSAAEPAPQPAAPPEPEPAEAPAPAPASAEAPAESEDAEAEKGHDPIPLIETAEDAQYDPVTGRRVEAQGDEDDAAPHPVPDSGVVAIKAAALGPDLMMEFPWAGPVRAAAFRRAGAIWIVFDAQAGLDVSEIQRGQRHVTDVQTLTGPGYSALRITAPETTQVSLRQTDAPSYGWTFVLAESAETPPSAIRVERRAEEGEPNRLFAVLPDAGDPILLHDPAVGDTLIVAPAHRPARGVLDRRDYLTLSILPSAQGLAIQSLSTELQVHAGPEGVWITPPQRLSVPAAARTATGSLAFTEFAPADETGAAFARAQSALERKVAANPLPEAHMDMARFFLARELAHEALGALDMALEQDALLAADPEFRALRGAAHAVAGRLARAESDLSLPVLTDDPGVELWRGYVKTLMGDWTGARRAFAKGENAIGQFNPEWRARFREAYASAALALGDLSAAKAQIDEAGLEDAPQDVALRVALDEARWREAAGQTEQALTAYRRLTSSGEPEIEARAILASARLQQELGTASPSELIETLEALRWRWRGDDVELQTIRALGKLYVADGAHRQGLEAMEAAVARFPDHPVSREIFTDMMAMFSDLFLNGGADRMDPVEAMALYFQFSELTPAGSEGDRMIRRLVERQVAFDLLPQAAELLQHQVDNRLHEPRDRAEVAADLALIYLMDRRPEPALRALRSTRVTRLPPELAEERRIIEARALAELEAHDAALDLIAGDPSIEAARVRADIAWRLRDWPAAGQRLEDMLGERWDAPGPLGGDDASAVLRAAVAYSLARDQAALARLSQRYGALMSGTNHAAAFTAVTQELETSGLRLSEIADRAADTAALEAFLNRRRGRLESGADAGPSASLDYAPDPAPEALASAQ